MWSILIFGVFAFVQSSASTSVLEAADCVECSIAKPAPPISESAQKKLKDISEKVLSLDDRFFLDPQFIEQMDSRKLGEMIVKRLADMCDKIRDPDLKKPAENSSEIIMLVPEQHLESIAKNGFKNQHETITTNGNPTPDIRLDAEMKHVHLGLPYSQKTRELLPKYALQVFNDKSMGFYAAPLSYGKVMFRFKPQVKKRSTWSNLDSLSVEYTLQTNSMKPDTKAPCTGYCEAQIWGELDMTDVSSIVVEKGREVTKEMKALGVPIYTYSRSSEDGFFCSEEDHEKAKTSLCGIEIGLVPYYTPSEDAVVPRKANLSIESATEKYEASDKNSASKNIFNGIRLSKMSTESLMQEYKKGAKERAEYLVVLQEQRKRAKEAMDQFMKQQKEFLKKIAEEHRIEQQEMRLAKEQNSMLEPKPVKITPMGMMPMMDAPLVIRVEEERAFTDLQTRTLAEIATRSSDKKVLQFLLDEYKNAEGEDGRFVKTMALTGLANLNLKELRPILLEVIKDPSYHVDASKKIALRGIAMMIALQHKDDPEIAQALREHSDLFRRMEKNETCFPKKLF